MWFFSPHIGRNIDRGYFMRSQTRSARAYEAIRDSNNKFLSPTACGLGALFYISYMTDTAAILIPAVVPLIAGMSGGYFIGNTAHRFFNNADVYNAEYNAERCLDEDFVSDDERYVKKGGRTGMFIGALIGAVAIGFTLNSQTPHILQKFELLSSPSVPSAQAVRGNGKPNWLQGPLP
jgi:hypothetical protein